MNSVRPLFYVIGNCVKMRAAGTKRFNLVKCFGSGSGHGPLLYFSIFFKPLLPQVINNFYAQYEIKTFVYNSPFVYNGINRYNLAFPNNFTIYERGFFVW